jgi:hypothetical protein
MPDPLRVLPIPIKLPIQVSNLKIFVFGFLIKAGICQGPLRAGCSRRRSRYVPKAAFHGGQ